MLYAATLRCPHAHARVVKVDLSKAREMPGVRAILSDADKEAQIPWYPTEGPDPPGPQPPVRPALPLSRRGSRRGGGRNAVRRPGTPYGPSRWNTRSCPSSPPWRMRLKPGAPAVHEGGNRAAPPRFTPAATWPRGSPRPTWWWRRPTARPANCTARMEVHGCVAQWDGDQLTLWDSTQSPFDIQQGVAESLRHAAQQGAGRSAATAAASAASWTPASTMLAAALLARKTGRPVKYFLTREEDFLCVGNRPAHSMKLKAGVKKDGTLMALELNGCRRGGRLSGGRRRRAACCGNCTPAPM